MNFRTFSLCVRLIRAIYDVIAPTVTVGYAPGFTCLMKVVAHTVANKDSSMILSSSLSMPRPRLEWIDAVHVLRCF